MNLPRPVLALLVCALLAGFGCRHRAPSSLPGSLQDLQSEALPFALKASLSLQVNAPRWSVVGSTGATIVIRRPDSLFLQVRGPVGGVLLEALVTPSRLDLLLPSRNLRIHGDDPARALTDLTRGALAVDTLLALLTGTLPPGDLHVTDQRQEGESTVFSLEAPEGTRVRVATDPGVRALQSLEIRSADDQERLRLDWQGRIKAEGRAFPETVAVRVPALDLSFELRFRDWQTLGDTGTIFQPRELPALETISVEEALERFSGTGQGQ